MFLHLHFYELNKELKAFHNALNSISSESIQKKIFKTDIYGNPPLYLYTFECFRLI